MSTINFNTFYYRQPDCQKYTREQGQQKDKTFSREMLERELLMRNRTEFPDNKVEKSKKEALFSEKCGRQFDRQSFLDILGIDLDGEINWDADGTSELTEDQISYLKEKYDVENLSQSDFYHLLMELSNMNVISKDDVKNQFMRQGVPTGYVVSAANENFSQWMNSGSNYLSRFENEGLMYDYFIQALMSGRTSVKSSDLFTTKLYYERQKEISNTMAEIFNKIKRTN